MKGRLAAVMVLTMVCVSCAAEPEVASTTVATTTTTSTTTTTEPTTTTTEATTTTTTIFVPDGYVMVEIEAEGIRLGLPDSWITVDLTQEGWAELLTAGLEALPEAAQLINNEAEAIINEGGLLLAYDLENQADGFTTNVNILESGRGPLDEPDVFLAALGAQLELFGAVDPAIDLVEVPLGPAIKASYGFAPETGFTHQAVQYYVFAVGSVYIVTFSTANLIDLEFVFETIMSTFDAAG
jgi:hypothetical protein